ncbi:MAG: PstS family phosphate ABC transporter substrate-binding protein [Anaerolineae bacterium]|nr:PstS family phosphate ABC transporter substrate-binding protein [Anaerolineae bacterium]
MKKNITLTVSTAIAATMLAACAPAPTTAPAKPAAQATTAAKPAETAGTYGAVNAKTGLPDIDPTKVQGNIVTAGSSTVFPLSQRVTELFKDEGYKGQITIDSVGTGAGFERFCKGETDISNASAKISDKQVEACQKNNITPVEFRVATDALAIVVNPKNTWAQSLTEKQIADIFAGKAKTWKEVDAAYPDKKIILYSPGTDSGTFDYFVEHFYKKDKKPILDAKPQLSEDDNVLVQGVSGDEGAIGYFGFAYFVANSSKVRAVKVGDVEPNQANVDAGKYSVARPLFIYSSAKIMKEKPQVAAFINFYLANVDRAFKKVAYFPAPAADATSSKNAWLNAVK